jgi:hypothetical protein
VLGSYRGVCPQAAPGANYRIGLLTRIDNNDRTTPVQQAPRRSSDEPTAATGWPANAPAAPTAATPTEPTAPAAPTNPQEREMAADTR